MQVKRYEMKAAEVKTYEFGFGAFDDDDEAFPIHGQEQEAPSEILDRLARDEMEKFPAFTYRQALDRVMEQRPELVRAYAGEHGTKPARVYTEGADPSQVIDRKARSLLDNGECKTYGEAAQKVLSEDPALTRRYRDYTSADVRRAG